MDLFIKRFLGSKIDEHYCQIKNINFINLNFVIFFFIFYFLIINLNH